MTDQLISFETAKLAKEKGFNICTFDYYRITGSGPIKSNKPYDHNNDMIMETAGGMLYLSAPTQSLLQKWLREKYNIDIDVNRGGVRDDWYLGWRKFGYGYNKSNSIYCTYESALEQGLIEALKLIP